MPLPHSYVVAFVIAVNIVAFLIMMFDKSRSQKPGYRRISEGKMFFWATILGSVGVYLGMFIFRHKTKKWYFVFGIPLIMLQNFAFLHLLSMWLFI